MINRIKTSIQELVFRAKVFYITQILRKPFDFRYIPEATPREECDSTLQYYKNSLRETHSKRVLSDEALEEYAKMYYMLGQIVGVQFFGKGDTQKVYALTYTSNQENALSIEIMASDISPKPYYFMAGSREYSLNDPNTLARIRNLYMEEIVNDLLEHSQYGFTIDNANATSENLGVYINMEANDIAQNSRRGCGNTIIIDTADVERFKASLSIGDKNLAEVEEHLSEVNSDNSWLLRYEFTFNKSIRVFSSSLFNAVKGEDGNAIMLYKGRSGDTDCATFLIVGDLLGKSEQGETFTNFEVKSVDDISHPRKHKYTKANNYIRLCEFSFADDYSYNGHNGVI